jgi:hypothetical protein
MLSVEHHAFAEPRKPSLVRRCWGGLRAPWMPPRLGGPLLAAWVLLLIPAMVGVVMSWHAWPVLGLMMPAVALIGRLGHVEARARGIVKPSRPSAAGIPVTFVTGLVLQSVPERYAGLILVASMLSMEPIERMRWRRRLRDRATQWRMAGEDLDAV